VFIEEHTTLHQSAYDICSRDKNGHKVVHRTIYARYAKVPMPNGTVRHIIYDEQMCPIEPICHYLKERAKKYSPNTVERCVAALRLLVVFCEAHGINDFMIPDEMCNEFVEFLRRGGKVTSGTAAEYFNDVKGFLIDSGHKNDPLMAATTKIRYSEGADGKIRPEEHLAYVYAPKRSHEREKVSPPHNSLNDYFSMLTEIRKKGDAAGCIILIMLFLLGRRIGEVLGLTIEDVSTRVDESTGEIQHCLYLRDRCTDITGQFAKNRFIPKTTNDYKSNDYIDLYNLPRDCIIIEGWMYELIKEYILTKHQEAAMKHPQKYKNAKADIVNPDKFQEEWGLEENHYLFLDNNGSCLRKHAWNKRMHQYFQLAKIPLGRGKGINHSWRHTLGYIMRHELHMKQYQIAAVLGHMNPNSSEVYAKGDYKDIVEWQGMICRYVLDRYEEFKNDEN